MTHQARTFTLDQLDEIGVPFELDEDGCATELHNRQVDTRRWVSVHELVFRAPDDGKAYRVRYQQPLTEHQECDRWFGDDEVKAVEVEQMPVTVMQWKPVAAPATTEDLASADNPTHLRWGLDDVLWGDDDTVIVLMSGPDLEPYWLELDPDRAAVLRRNLAGPAEDPAPAEDFTGTQPCGHDDYHDPHEWADRPDLWCPGHSHDDDQVAPTEESTR